MKGGSSKCRILATHMTKTVETNLHRKTKFYFFIPCHTHGRRARSLFPVEITVKVLRKHSADHFINELNEREKKGDWLWLVVRNSSA